MAVTRPQLGEELVTLNERIVHAETVVRQLEANRWDFAAAPDVFARRAACDVAAKEVAIFFDGRQETMIGKLVMAGAGTHFNLMGGNHIDSEFLSKPNTVLEDINKELGTSGLQEFGTMREMQKPQRIYFYNRTKFFQLRDMVFWLVLHGAGCFPSSLEVMKRHFASGRAIHNNLFRPPRPSEDTEKPAIMTSEGSDLFLSFPTDVVQFMEPSVHGGLIKETMHIEYLLTLEPTTIAHPHLSLADDGLVHIGGQRWFIRKFSGVSPKQGVRGPGVPPEGPDKRAAQGEAAS